MKDFEKQVARIRLFTRELRTHAKTTYDRMNQRISNATDTFCLRLLPLAKEQLKNRLVQFGIRPKLKIDETPQYLLQRRFIGEARFLSPIPITKPQRRLHEFPKPSTALIATGVNHELSMEDITEFYPSASLMRLEYSLAKGERIHIEHLHQYELEDGGKHGGRRTIQIYRNRFGFLVADLVVEPTNEIVSNGTTGNDSVEADQRIQGRDAIIPYPLEFHPFYGRMFGLDTEKKTLPDGEIQLLKWEQLLLLGGGSYRAVDIIVKTDKDDANRVIIEFMDISSNNEGFRYLCENFGPPTIAFYKEKAQRR